MLDNHESPAAPAEHYDTLATLPPNTSKSDAMDLLLCKLGQLRDLCNTCSAEGDKPIHGVFWLLADALQCCEQLGGIAFKAVTVAEHDTPEQTAPTTIPDTSDSYIAIPETRYNDLSVTLETLNAQLLIASDTEIQQTNTERTLSAFVLGMQREVERAMNLISDCSRVHPFKHRHGPDREQAQ